MKGHETENLQINHRKIQQEKEAQTDQGGKKISRRADQVARENKPTSEPTENTAGRPSVAV